MPQASNAARQTTLLAGSSILGASTIDNVHAEIAAIRSLIPKVQERIYFIKEELNEPDRTTRLLHEHGSRMQP